jgi:hypothetical protein
MSREERLESLLRETLTWLSLEAVECPPGLQARVRDELEQGPLAGLPTRGTNCRVTLRTGEEVRANWEGGVWESCDGSYRTFKPEDIIGWSVYGG